MRLAELIEHLANARPDAVVRIAWPEHRYGYGPYAGRFTSYRGYYDQLALTPGDEPRTAADLLADARAAVGATFEGWKGGDYVMDLDTPVWAAEEGDAGSLGLSAPLVTVDGLTFPTIDVSDYQGW